MQQEDSPVDLSWSARSVRPVTLVHVTGVFAGFMALAQFVFHSSEAVAALAVAGLGSLVGLAPNVLGRFDYRLTEVGLFKQRERKRGEREPKRLFAWDELSYITSTGSGYKYFKRFESSNLLDRFWKLHISDKYSGEFHLEEEDRLRVLELFERRGIPTSKPVSTKAIGSPSSSRR